ncbi:histidine phosphatase family protein [Mesorhizobium sp. NBSH29]|uniref:SixA phosphatase family protein n=1 Tax=Mesorhizobium sp. NBSH29 TaxID=2654249 RepID=UPI001896588E|nr:histidine phosphatase family protein [Mesorhizobium sp. NBSH29]QPC87945.1 histidine phosphatase family protein [Mesorhizobium sp. NBSH29]
MARLLLLRHARAGWAAPGMRDFDRPLDAAGAADAVATGAAMRMAGYTPDVILCSAAVRARDTLHGLLTHSAIDRRRVSYLEALYSEDAQGYLSLVNDYGGEHSSLMLVGHNPMMEDLGMALTGDGEESARASILRGFPTAGLAVFRFDTTLTDAAPGKGYLEAFLTPADY